MAMTEESLELRVERRLRENADALRESQRRDAARTIAANRVAASIGRKIAQLRRRGLAK
jgi:hypothetical protein